MIHVDRVIVVEGKYDRAALARLTDATVIETGGFGIFRNRELQKTLRTLAEKKGLLILTDSDRAGNLIRNFLISSIGSDKIRNAYIPERYGKEKRKPHPSKEGKLGVEGMDEATLRSVLTRCSEPMPPRTDPITSADLYALGLLGRENSSEKRAEFQRSLDLPSHLSPRRFLEMMNCCMSKREFEDAIAAFFADRKGTE